MATIQVVNHDKCYYEHVVSYKHHKFQKSITEFAKLNPKLAKTRNEKHR